MIFRPSADVRQSGWVRNASATARRAISCRRSARRRASSDDHGDPATILPTALSYVAPFASVTNSLAITAPQSVSVPSGQCQVQAQVHYILRVEDNHGTHTRTVDHRTQSFLPRTIVAGHNPSGSPPMVGRYRLDPK